jgi:hypothetical protein
MLAMDMDLAAARLAGCGMYGASADLFKPQGRWTEERSQELSQGWDQ